jgi:uncharacterized protein YaiI (UPF0178 family)
MTADMTIWVDADACPAAIRDILYRAADRTRRPLVLVANQPLRPPRSPNIRAVQVAGGFDEADRHIIEHCAEGDIVVTADIPLAASVIERGGHALTPRGETLDAGNVGPRLTLRNFMDELRGSGVDTGGGPPPMAARDRQRFAAGLEKLLNKG